MPAPEPPVSQTVEGEIPATVSLEQTVDLGKLGTANYSQLGKLVLLVAVLFVVAYSLKRK
jgi:hypothetical protein